MANRREVLALQSNPHLKLEALQAAEWAAKELLIDAIAATMPSGFAQLATFAAADAYAKAKHQRLIAEGQIES